MSMKNALLKLVGRSTPAAASAAVLAAVLLLSASVTAFAAPPKRENADLASVSSEVEEEPVENTEPEAEEMSAEAAPLWNSKVRHLSDGLGLIAEDFRIQENNENKKNVEEAEFDFAMILLDDPDMGGRTFPEYIDALYEHNSLGYGPNKDGIYLGISVPNETFCIRLFGSGKRLFSRSDVDELIGILREAYLTDGYAGVMHEYRVNAFDMVMKARESGRDKKTDTAAFEGVETPFAGTERGTAPVINGVLMPSWYVEDPENFVDFHCDESTPRLIDNADILTPAQENTIINMLADIRKECNQDVVIMTDTTSYDLDNELYEMDFYVYNGYGIGDDFDGIQLFINMDPDNREMVSTAFGKTRTVFTKSNSNHLDDILYDHLVNQEYADAFIDWGASVKTLMLTGGFIDSKWYNDYRSGTIPKNQNETKIYLDNIEDIDPDQKAGLLEEMAGIREAYQVDPVVYVGRKAIPLDPYNAPETDDERIEQFLDTFYESCGYGLGENKSGVLLGFLISEGSGYKAVIRTFGDVEMTPKVKKKLAGHCLWNLSEHKFGDNIKPFLYYLKGYLKMGRLPHSGIVKFFWFILCLISGFISRGICKRYDIKPKKHEAVIALAADELLVPGSFKLIRSNDILEYISTESVRFKTTPTRHTDYSSRSSYSSSGSSHTSSYSSHSTSSSGRSGSTSRRKF